MNAPRWDRLRELLTSPDPAHGQQALDLMASISMEGAPEDVVAQRDARLIMKWATAVEEQCGREPFPVTDPAALTMAVVSGKVLGAHLDMFDSAEGIGCRLSILSPTGAMVAVQVIGGCTGPIDIKYPNGAVIHYAHSRR